MVVAPSSIRHLAWFRGHAVRIPQDQPSNINLPKPTDVKNFIITAIKSRYAEPGPPNGFIEEEVFAAALNLS
jgi:hypothetical protein